MTPRLNVAVLCGNEMLRNGIAGLLRAVPEVNATYPCAHRYELTSLLRGEPVDTVILTAPDAHWFCSSAQIIAPSGVGTLIVVDTSSVDHLPSHFRCGGGYLWQPELNMPNLREALRRSHDAEPVIPAELVRAMLDRPERPRGRTLSLTDRERETLSLVVRGLSNKEIARRLTISSNGVKRLVASIMLKLDAPNRTAAAVTAIRTGLVEAE